MRISSFLKLVEIQTKVASVIPFLIGTLYAIYHYNSFILKNFLLMFVSLICIDMATTAINNYQDFKKANLKQGYGYESHNAIVRDKLSENSVKTAIFILLSLAVLFGFLLYLNTGIVVLILGSISFAIGVLYSYGPVPISRTPFGEIFSGGTMGFFIPFLAAYIHIYDQSMIILALEGSYISIAFNALELLKIALVSLPAIIAIGDIMLANNICDIEDDIQNSRYTLPIYIGRDRALKVFTVSYYFGYIAILALIVFKAIPYICILTLGTFILVNKNIRLFTEHQSKKDTFVLAVKNFIILNAAFALTLGLGIILRNFI